MCIRDSTYTLRPHQPQPPRLHSTATSTTTAPLHPTATLTTARNFAQQSRLNSSAENFSYFFKKALDKYPKTVYNVYCCLLYTSSESDFSEPSLKVSSAVAPSSFTAASGSKLSSSACHGKRTIILSLL